MEYKKDIYKYLKYKNKYLEYKDKYLLKGGSFNEEIYIGQKNSSNQKDGFGLLKNNNKINIGNWENDKIKKVLEIEKDNNILTIIYDLSKSYKGGIKNSEGIINNNNNKLYEYLKKIDTADALTGLQLLYGDLKRSGNGIIYLIDAEYEGEWKDDKLLRNSITYARRGLLEFADFPKYSWRSGYYMFIPTKKSLRDNPEKNFRKNRSNINDVDYYCQFKKSSQNECTYSGGLGEKKILALANVTDANNLKITGENFFSQDFIETEKSLSLYSRLFGHKFL
jgi:hypothetical protein